MTLKFRKILSFITLFGLCLTFLAACGSSASSSGNTTATPQSLALAYRTLPPDYYVTATALPKPTATSTPIALEVPSLPPLPSPRPTESDKAFGVLRAPGSSAYLGGGDDITVGEPTAQALDNWLARFNSPHLKEAPAGQTIGEVYIKMGRKWGINPAYALAFFSKESTCGTAGSNLASFNFGNIRWTTGYPTIDTVWRSYKSWSEGMEDWFRLLNNEYLARGLRTVEQIVPIYAPPFENDTDLYIYQIKQWSRQIMGDNSPVPTVTRKPPMIQREETPSGSTTPNTTQTPGSITPTPTGTPKPSGTPSPATTRTIGPSRPNTRP